VTTATTGTLARRGAEREHDEDDRDGADVDRAPVPAVDVRIDEQRGEEDDDADRHVDDLALQVVVRVVRQVEARDAGDRPEPDRNERGDGRDEDPVQAAEDAEHRDALAPVTLQSSSL
jgi:hypothetical protein